MIAAREAERAARAPRAPSCDGGQISSDLHVAAADECSSVLFCVSGKLKVGLIQVEYCSKEMPLPSTTHRAHNLSSADPVNKHVYVLVRGLEDR